MEIKKTVAARSKAGGFPCFAAVPCCLPCFCDPVSKLAYCLGCSLSDSG
jgi:hypothetical protein